MEPFNVQSTIFSHTLFFSTKRQLQIEEMELLNTHAHIRWTVSHGTVGHTTLIHSSIPFPGPCSLAWSRGGFVGRGLGVRRGRWRALCWYHSWIRSCSSTQCLFDCIYQRVPEIKQWWTIHFTWHIEMYCQVYIILHRKKMAITFCPNTSRGGLTVSALASGASGPGSGGREGEVHPDASC